MKKLFLLAAILLTAGRAEAGPLDFFKHPIRTMQRHPVATAFAFAGVAAGVDGLGLRHCRRVNGVEPCDEHYGAAWANFGIVTGMNVIVMPSVARACWKGGQGHFCDAFAFGGSAAQAGWGIHEWHIKTAKIDK